MIPIATLLVAMPTSVITSWQSHFFSCLFHLCDFPKSLSVFTNLDQTSQTVDAPTVVAENSQVSVTSQLSTQALILLILSPS